MKRGSVILVAAVAGVVASLAWFGSSPPAAADGTAHAVMTGPPQVLWQYGHIKALVRKGARYELRFDPAYWLGGVTATRAALEDKAIAPGEPVPNDYYIRDETHRLLTYLVPATASVTVLTIPGAGPKSTRISVSELAQIVKGKNPTNRPLFSPTLGFWMRYRLDTVRALDQQYQP